MTSKNCLGLLLHCFAAVSVLVSAAAQAQSGITQYTAEYQAEYKGRNVGRATFSVQQDAASGNFIYSSETRAKGLLRLAAPNPVIDQSTFTVRGDAVVPLNFMHQDGSRKGDDNHQIAFDWDNNTARVQDENGNHEIQLEPGVLDRGSLQVALMRDFQRDDTPRTYKVADEDELSTYSFTYEGKHMLSTELGEVAVERYAQQRAGSSRRTLIDFAPDLGFVPVRIEQLRDGESRSAFYIDSLDIAE